jgi:predicted ribosomally synthesized peptide with SipW-like signal peptide
MISRFHMALAAGVAGIATLALVGTGAAASFTDSVTSTNTITSGNFQLTAEKGSAAVNDPNNGVNPYLNAGNITTSKNTVSYTMTNADPAATYTYQFSVEDTGTLPGEIDNVVYTPMASPSAGQSALLDNMYIQVAVLQHGKWVPLTTTHNGPENVSASAPATFDMYYDTDNNETDFINPSDSTNPFSQTQTYQVTVTFNNGTITNAAELQTVTSTLMLNGHQL